MSAVAAAHAGEGGKVSYEIKHVFCAFTTGFDQPVSAIAQRLQQEGCTAEPQVHSNGRRLWLYARDLSLAAKAAGTWLLLVDFVRRDSLTVYRLNPHHTAPRAVPAVQRDLSGGPLLGSLQVFALQAQAEPVAVLIQIDNLSDYTLLRTLQLMPDWTFYQQQDLMLFVFGAYMGVMLCMLIYNAVLYTALRYRFQLYYCASLLLMLCYGLLWSNLVVAIYPSLTPGQSVSLGYLFSSSAVVINVLFFLEFMEPHSVPKWLRRALMSSVLLTFGSALAASPHSPWVGFLDRCYNFGLCLTVILTLSAVVIALGRRSRAAFMFLLAWFPLLSAVMLVGLIDLELIPHIAWMDTALFVAAAIETMVLSVAMADRFRLIRRERDTAHRDQEKWKQLADMDPLTGIYNRRGLVSFCEAWLQRQDAEVPTALILFDVDHFKSINDNYGHDVGDSVIRQLVNAVKAGCREGDALGRMGGDEFAVVLPHTDAETAHNIAERLRIAANAIVTELRCRIRRPITVSIGIAFSSLDTQEFDALYARADKALYLAKGDGRNCVRIYRKPEPKTRESTAAALV